MAARCVCVVDFSPFMEDVGVVVGDAPTPAQAACATQIDRIAKEHGFMHITHWGMSQELNDEAFAAAEELFALPDTHKLEKLFRITPETNRGFAPFGLENLNRSRPPDMKETFNVRFEPAHTNDFRGCPERFQAVARRVQDVIEKAAKRYALACALALGLERDYFHRSLARMDLCTTRYLHYPPCDAVERDVDRRQRREGHPCRRAHRLWRVHLPPAQGGRARAPAQAARGRGRDRRHGGRRGGGVAGRAAAAR